MSRLRSLKKHLFLPFILSLVIGAAVCIVTALCFSLILWLLQLSVETGWFWGLLSLCCGSLAAGFALGRQKGRMGIKQGLLCSGGLFVICLIIGIFAGEVSFGGAILKSLLCCIAGIVGGVVGVNRR